MNILTSNSHFNLSHNDLILLVIIVIWELVWKAISLWKSARNDQLGWFIVITILNSFGILEIIYILFFQKKKS